MHRLNASVSPAICSRRHFRHGQLLAGGKVQHPAVSGGVVQRGGVGHLFRCGQDQQAAGQDGIVGTVKGQDLLAAAVAQGGCPPVGVPGADHCRR